MLAGNLELEMTEYSWQLYEGGDDDDDNDDDNDDDDGGGDGDGAGGSELTLSHQ